MIRKIACGVGAFGTSLIAATTAFAADGPIKASDAAFAAAQAGMVDKGDTAWMLVSSLPVLMMLKESVNRAWEGPLNEGLLFERRSLHATFALSDQKEGMAAFLEKRKPVFRDR